MFSATFLGHQGWLLSTGSTHVLVDPLLTERFGHAGVVGQVYPPRDLDLPRFPALHAVLLTHEHEDHFDIPSLHRLDRGIPILLSARSSLAARTVLQEMGFDVLPVSAGQRVRVGDLELQLFAPDLSSLPIGDEWDVVQFLARDLSGEGSFFSYVDVSATPATLRAVRRTTPRPGLWVHSNNANDLTLLELGEEGDHALMDIGTVAASVLNDVSAKRMRWGSPVAHLFAGGGFCFVGEQAWLNHHAFYAESERLAQSLAALYPDERFYASLPGQTFHMKQGAFAGMEERTPFLRTLPKERWPSREHRPGGALQDYAPASGQTELGEAELEELLGRLRELAAHLYAHPGFKKLYSRPTPYVGQRKSAFALQLIADEDGGAYVLEYSPQGCRFEPVECEDPMESYLVGVECWGTDLLALFRGEFGPTAIVFGRGRSWSYAADEFGATFTLSGLLWDFFHPLRRPDAFLALYRHLLAREPVEVPRVAAAPRVPLDVSAWTPVGPAGTER